MTITKLNEVLVFASGKLGTAIGFVIGGAQQLWDSPTALKRIDRGLIIAAALSLLAFLGFAALTTWMLEEGGVLSNLYYYEACITHDILIREGYCIPPELNWFEANAEAIFKVAGIAAVVLVALRVPFALRRFYL